MLKADSNLKKIMTICQGIKKFPGSSAGKESACNAGDLGLIPGLVRYPREGKGYPPQYSGLENSMASIVHGVAKNHTQLSDFHFTSKYWYMLQSGGTLRYHAKWKKSVTEDYILYNSTNVKCPE